MEETPQAKEVISVYTHPVLVIAAVLIVLFIILVAHVTSRD